LSVHWGKAEDIEDEDFGLKYFLHDLIVAAIGSGNREIFKKP
jgi:hypothetical protein